MSKSRIERTIILPDVHAPFHRKPLLVKIGQLIRDIKPDGVILSGDFVDLFSLSSYAENSLEQLRAITLTDEYRAGSTLLDDIGSVLPKGCKKRYLYGNHEDRYLRWLKKGDNAKVGSELISPQMGMRLLERGYEVFTNWQDDSIKLGEHLEIIHGIYTPVHASKKHLDEFQGSVVFGHTHRFGSYIDGKRGAYNIGFLGDKQSHGFDYVARTKRMRWINGFAIASVDDGGSFWIEAVQAWDDRFIANGKMY